MHLDYLKKLIQEETKKIVATLREQEEDLGGDLDLDLGGDALDSDPGGEDLGDDLGAGDDLGGDDLGGDADMDLDGEEGDDLGGDDGFGGGGDFGGGFGGGGGGGDLGGFGDDDDAGGEGDGEEGEEAPEPQDTVPDDPVQGVLDDVYVAMETTMNPQELLNVAKASVQKYFNDFTQAYDVITKLEMEEDPILQQVGERLSMFMKGF